MPRVPTYDGLQVGAATLPQTRLSIPDAPDAGPGLQVAGQNLSQAGRYASKIALDMAQQAAQLKINDLMNQAVAEKLRLTYDPEAGYVHLKGEAAIAGPDGKPRAQQYQENYDKFLSNLESGLGNDLQREMFRARIGALKQQFQNGLASHTAREFTTFKSSVQDGTIKIALDQMQLAWGDPEALQQAGNAIKAAVVEQGKLQGLSAIEIDANLVATLSKGHTAVIAGAIDAGQLGYAEKHLQRQQDEMTAADKIKIGAILTESKKAAAAQHAVDSLIQNYLSRAAPDARVGAALPLLEMKQALRKRFAHDPQTLKMAETALEKQHKELVDGQKQQDDQTLDTAYKQLYENGGNVDALSARLRMAIPGDKLGSVIDFAKKVGQGPRNDALAWAQIQSLPKEELAAMTPADFYGRFRPYLDDAHMEKGYALLKAAQSTEDGKHLEIATPAARVKNAAIKAGIIPARGKTTDAQLQAFADFQERVDQELRQFERVDLEGKRKANTEELQKILDRLLIDRVNVQQGLLGIDHLMWDRKNVPAFALTETQMEKAYVTVAGQEIKLASIPAAQRAQIIEALRKNSLPVTEQAIAEMWVRAGKPKD